MGDDVQRPYMAWVEVSDHHVDGQCHPVYEAMHLEEEGGILEI